MLQLHCSAVSQSYYTFPKSLIPFRGRGSESARERHVHMHVCMSFLLTHAYTHTRGCVNFLNKKDIKKPNIYTFLVQKRLYLQ